MPSIPYDLAGPESLFFPSEPRLDADEIQGNVLPGFAQVHQHHLFVTVTDVAAFKAAMSALLPSVVSTAAVVAARDASASGLRWLNVALTFEGLRLLGVPVDGAPLDEAFTQGMSARAGRLGDRDASAWRVSDRPGALHAALLLASDAAATLDAFVADVKAALTGARVVDELRGDASRLSGGREHFGFSDGRSQPGLFGWFLDAKGARRAVTGRRNPRNRAEGVPGQRLAPPERLLTGLAAGAPAWTRNGSYLVARVLQQHVGAMHRFVFDAAGALGVAPVLVASRILGRWPRGAPVLRADHDDHAVGSSPCAYNDFQFLRAGRPLGASTVAGDCGFVAPPAVADPRGEVCPFSAHIRKANPRDDEGASPSTGAALSADHNRARVIFRRSLPYGDASPSTFDAPVADAPGDDRGLVFLCYQSSIVEQFEFIQQGLVQDPDAPRPNSGHDALIGQGSDTAPRRFSLGTLPDGRAARCDGVPAWVTTRGGGYFFAPSISALAAMMA